MAFICIGSRAHYAKERDTNEKEIRGAASPSASPV